MLKRNTLMRLGHELKNCFDYVRDLSYTPKINELLDKLEEKDYEQKNARINS